MTLMELRGKRASAVAEMRALLDKATAESRDLDATETEKYEAVKADVVKLEGAIRRREEVDAFERRASGVPVTGSGDATLDRELRGFSLQKAILAGVPDSGVDCGRERELSAELARRMGVRPKGLLVPLSVFGGSPEQRTLTSATAGTMIPTDHLAGEFIPVLRNALAVSGLGARLLPGLVGSAEIPRQSGSIAAGWVNENAEFPESDLTFDSVTLGPKHVGALTQYSRNLLLQSSPGIEEIIRSDFAAVLAEAIDHAALLGSGTGAEPKGLLNMTGITVLTKGENGGAFGIDDPADMISALDAKNVIGSRGFCTNTAVKGAAMKLKDSEGRPYGLPGVFQGETVAFSNVLPHTLDKGTSTGVCSPLIYGCWSDMLLGMWGALELLTNPFMESAYRRGNVAVRGILTMDVQVRHAESFVCFKDLTTA